MYEQNAKKKMRGAEDDNYIAYNKDVHQNNMITPCTPLLYSETGVYRGIHYFLIFAL